MFHRRLSSCLQHAVSHYPGGFSQHMKLSNKETLHILSAVLPDVLCNSSSAVLQVLLKTTSEFHTGSCAYNMGSKGSPRHGLGRSVVESADAKQVQLTTAEKVKENAKTSFYSIVIIGGIGIFGVMMWALGRELFSGDSANGVYSQAVKDSLAHKELVMVLGEPVKSYGELSSRRRRRHTAHVEYEQDDYKYIRMQFYLEGSLRKGTVHLEKRKPKDSSENYAYRYLFVELDGHPSRTVILQDNRYLMTFNKI